MTDIDKVEMDNTYRCKLQSCERKYYLARELHIKPIRGSNALRYGSVWHAFKEGYYSHIKDNGWAQDGEAIRQAARYGTAVWNHITADSGQIFDENDYRTLENATKCFLQDCAENIDDMNMLEVIDTEQMFDHVMELTKKEKDLFPNLVNKEVHFQGRLDVQVKLSGINWIKEEKSTGQNLSLQTSRLHRSPQIVGYSYAGRHALKFPAEGCLVCIHQVLSRRKKDGDWGSLTVNFIRSPEIFTDEDLLAWRESFLATCAKLVQHQEADFWPMQFDSCYQFGRCEYCNICESNISLSQIRDDADDGIAPEGYMIKENKFLDFSTKLLLTKSGIGDQHA